MEGETMAGIEFAIYISLTERKDRHRRQAELICAGDGMKLTFFQ